MEKTDAGAKKGFRNIWKPVAATVHRWGSSFVQLFFPHRCVVCGNLLQEGEEVLCLRCNIRMPRTHFHQHIDNYVERLFWGKLPLGHASSYIFYQKGSACSRILHALKYEGRQDVGNVMGRWMAAELQETGFFDGVDVIVPVPLHRKRQRMRGYNQSECLARGIAQVTGIPVDVSSVERVKHTQTQTHRSAFDRWVNVEGIFRLQCPESFVGKHVLVVDDVLTTGATTTACADVFAGIEGICISVLTLAVAER